MFHSSLQAGGNLNGNYNSVNYNYAVANEEEEDHFSQDDSSNNSSENMENSSSMNTLF